MIVKRIIGVFLVIMLNLSIFSGLGTAYVTQDESQLSFENNTIYLHYDETKAENEKYWMNSSIKSVTDSYSDQVNYTDAFEDYTFNFPLTPILDNNLMLDTSVQDNIVVTLHIKTDTNNPLSLSEVSVKWNYGQTTIDSDTLYAPDSGYISFNLHWDEENITSGTQISLQVDFRIIPQTTFDFFTDSTSTVTLSLLEDTDGEPDGEDGGDGDGKDDDKDSQNDNMLMYAGIGIIIIIAIIIGLRIRKKRREEAE